MTAVAETDFLSEIDRAAARDDAKHRKAYAKLLRQAVLNAGKLPPKEQAAFRDTVAALHFTPAECHEHLHQMRKLIEYEGRAIRIDELAAQMTAYESKSRDVLARRAAAVKPFDDELAQIGMQHRDATAQHASALAFAGHAESMKAEHPLLFGEQERVPVPRHDFSTAELRRRADEMEQRRHVQNIAGNVRSGGPDAWHDLSAEEFDQLKRAVAAGWIETPLPPPPEVHQPRRRPEPIFKSRRRLEAEQLVLASGDFSDQRPAEEKIREAELRLKRLEENGAAGNFEPQSPVIGKPAFLER